MKKKIVSILLALALGVTSFSNISYAQEVQKEVKVEATDEPAVELTEEQEAEPEVVQQEWKLEGVKFDKESPQPISESIKISADVENPQEGLQYKFVWMKDNWKEWGVLQNFSELDSVEWQPKSVGNYEFYIDVKDAAGNKASVNKKYVIMKNQWSYSGITPNTSVIKLGEKITIAPKISGNTKGLQYKFVWMRNNWKEWKVLQPFSSEKEVEFTPDKTGKCTIYVDVKDQEGKVTSKSISYDVKHGIWKYDGVATSVPSPQENNAGPITIKAKTSGDTKGLKYKFVWMKDNWKEWGVIQNSSEANAAEWNPKKVGTYTIYVDVKDLDGKTVTKTISYQIVKPQWKYEKVVTDPANEQKKQQNVGITAVTTGNTKGLQYKFVWMKDNWKEWGVIQPFSEKNTATWKTPNKSGQYTLYVDVKDSEGETRTKAFNYFVISQVWEPGEININDGVKEEVYTKIPITATATGETQDLQYRFRWSKGEKSGVIRDFSTSNKTSSWCPKEPGVYKISVDIQDVDGNRKTFYEKYEVLPAPWKFEKIDLAGSPDRFVGDKVKVTAVMSGKTEGLQYKFVCRRGSDWSDWEVAQNFSEKNSVTISLSKAKDYNIYIDIKDRSGVTVDTKEVVIRSHKYNAAAASTTKVGKGQSVKLYPNITGATGELQFKYVWMQNNWQKWGTIKDFSSSSSVTWTPPAEGKYTVYIDVKANGVVQSKSINIDATNTKNGWYYEGGYKFYYKDGVKQLDLDGILPKQSSYYIQVNRQTCTVTVYAKDGNNGYIIPVKRFACSVGLPSTPTPKGTFYTPARYRWHELMGPSYGQYCTRITGSILFHSVAGYNKTSYNLNARDYNMLGKPASHGCVRLCVRDAKWIYDNCPLKTKVTIYDSSYPGPLGKPATIKIPAGQTWDPTDPNI